MIGKRELKSFSRSHLPNPEAQYFHKTFTPKIDTVACLEFDMRFASKSSHLSTTMFLERTFTVEPKVKNPYNRYWGYEETEDTATAGDVKYAVKPGFLLQQNCENFFMNYNSSSDKNMNPNIWLRPYSKLYADQLENLCRGSGRVIRSNQQPDTVCRDMLYFRSNEDAFNPYDMSTFRDEPNEIRAIYPFPDRIERRIERQ